MFQLDEMAAVDLGRITRVHALVMRSPAGAPSPFE